MNSNPILNYNSSDSNFSSLDVVLQGSASSDIHENTISNKGLHGFLSSFIGRFQWSKSVSNSNLHGMSNPFSSPDLTFFERTAREGGRERDQSIVSTTQSYFIQK